MCFWASLYAAAPPEGNTRLPTEEKMPLRSLLDPVELCREVAVALRGHSDHERRAVLAVWSYGERMIRDVDACKERTLAELRLLRERLAYLNAFNHTLASLAGVRPG